MPKVNDVVSHDEFEIQILTIRRVPHMTKSLRINVTDHRSQLRVVSAPEFNDVRPWTILVALDTNPFVTVITRQINASSELQTYKPLMVIRGRIDQVSQNFFLGPF